MNRCFNLLLAALAVAGCSGTSSFGGFRLASSDSPDIQAQATSFNGYTNHWQNRYQTSYRAGNLFKVNNSDIEKTYRSLIAEFADDLGVTGLQMQNGFLKGILENECTVLENPSEKQFKETCKSSQNILVYADLESELGGKFSSMAPAAPANIGNYQVKAENYNVLNAFALKKGRKTVYVAVGKPEKLANLKSAVENCIEVLGKYEMKRGWFGVETLDRSVTCTQGNQLDVIGRGMNEGNSWFVFSGYCEHLTQPLTQKWMDEVGVPVVVDHGYDPLYGSDDYSSLQVQLMGGLDDWRQFRKEHGGYLAGGLPDDTVVPESDIDIYFANLGKALALNRSNVPFVITTGQLLEGTSSCMILFHPKGEEFNKAAMWNAILGCRAVASIDGTALTGPDTYRKALELLMTDREYIEDYFADKISMESVVEGHKMAVTVTNFHNYAVSGTVSLKLPEQISAGEISSSKVSLKPGETVQLALDINPSAAAMGQMNAVVAEFDWGTSSKQTLASCNLPPAISVHQLLYGTESGCKFPVGVHNITADSSVKVEVKVCDASDPANVVFTADQTLEAPNGYYADAEFDLNLPAGSYKVITSAMGTEACTQLGIGKDEGEVTLKEVDLNNDGVNEYILENSKVRVALLTTGARIIEYYVKEKDDNVFFKLWPDGPCDQNRSFRVNGFWPFGGFEDFLGQASMETHKVYDAEVVRNDGKCAEVRMRAEYYGNVIEKIYTLYGNTPLIGLRYALDFVNPELSIIGPQPILVLGKTHGTEDKFIVPEDTGLNTYVMNPEKMYGRVINLTEGWNAGYDTVEDIHFVGAYPVNRPYFLHMWMNLDTNGESHYPYTELQPWLPIYTGNTTFFSYYMWADGGSWQNGLQELRNRNLITSR